MAPPPDHRSANLSIFPIFQGVHAKTGQTMMNRQLSNGHPGSSPPSWLMRLRDFGVCRMRTLMRCSRPAQKSCTKS